MDEPHAGRESPWLTSEQAAEYLGVTRQTIYKACALSGLKHSRLSGRGELHIKRDWLDQWLEQRARQSDVRTTKGGA